MPPKLVPLHQSLLDNHCVLVLVFVPVKDRHLNIIDILIIKDTIQVSLC